MALLLLLAGSPLSAQNGSLKVTSYPSGAEVWVDGQFTGKVTPMSTVLPVGEHGVTVRLPGEGWNPDNRVVTIVPGNNDLSVTLLPVLIQGPPGPEGPAGPSGPPGSAVPATATVDVDCGAGDNLAAALAEPALEHMCALYVDTRNRPLGWTVAHIGTINRAAVEPRSILVTGLGLNAQGFIMSHYVARHIMRVMWRTQLCFAIPVGGGSTELPGAGTLSQGT